MTPERWEQVSNLFEAASKCELAERDDFLARACAGDGEMRAEVESLLAEHERAGGFLNSPASIEAASALRETFQPQSISSEHYPHLGLTIKNRYRIEAGLARGGQSVVYRARDLMLMSKPVVVKVLSASVGQDTWMRKKFQQEMEALSRIDHPGVVGVLDAGKLENGSPYLVMQYVEGMTLREALERGPLDPIRAASALRQIGAALEAVHTIGIAHRDLKPENIILQRLSDGTELVKLIDFGIARVEKSEFASGTTTSMVAGTVRYMAPEQFQGENSRASDIYSLSLIACEMLSGQPEIQTLRAPRRVRDLIRAALAHHPQDRPGSASGFSNQLAEVLLQPRSSYILRMAAMIAAVLVTLALLGFILIKPDRGAAEVQTLAILPFDMLGPAAEMEPLEVGVADALITRLSNISGLIVRPISTVRRYNVSTVDPVSVARELQVDAVVEGTLQFFEGGIRANVRLIRAQDGKALWAGTIDSHSRHLFTLEDSIAQQIALHVNATLTESERRGLESRRQLNPDAHELYVKGRYEWGKRTREGFEKAAEYFRQAIDLDPTYARAHVGLADCYLLLGGYSYYPMLEMLPKAKLLASRALELDPGLGEAHATLGLISQNLDWDWKNVEGHYLKAISLTPNYATAHHWYAEFLSILGRFEESRREFALARKIDPISPIIEVDEAQLYFFQRQYDRSLEILQRVAQMDPDFQVAYERLAFAYMAKGHEEEAWEKIQSFGECREETSDCRRIWTAYLPKRDAVAARKAVLWLEAEAKRRHIPPSALAYAHARQGEYDRALDWLEYMLDKHEVWLITSKVNPLFDSLRAQPRFQKVLDKLHLN